MNEREKLLDRMIQLYGFEDDIVIEFARFIEDNNITTEVLERIVVAHEENPVTCQEPE